jgi:hypothetical protein
VLFRRTCDQAASHQDQPNHPPRDGPWVHGVHGAPCCRYRNHTTAARSNIFSARRMFKHAVIADWWTPSKHREILAP